MKAAHKLTDDKDLVQLSRLALAGRHQDIQMYIRRLARRYQAEHPSLSEQLSDLLRSAPTRESPLRKEAVAAIPVDTDSRLQLVRFDAEPSVEVEPIWAEVVHRSLEQVVIEREHEKELLQAGLDPTRTLLFTGPPGVGKTLAARWLARELKRPLLTLDLSAVMSSFLGRTGTNVRNVLDYAKSVDCILFLDELDAVAKRRDDVAEVGELKRLVTVILQEIDDWPPMGLLIAATNHPDLLDPAVWRRFDVCVEFPMPDPANLSKAIALYLDELPDCNLWQSVLTVILKGSSFSDVERTLLQARRESIVRQLPLPDVLERFVRDRLQALSRQDRAQVAVMLMEMNLSQRKVHELTGVSRDTIRKALKGQAE